MTTREKVLRERKSFPLISNSYEKISEESLQQVSSPYAWQRKSNDWFIKWSISQNTAERPLFITIILNNFKSLIKKVYQKGCTHKFNKKNDEHFFRAEKSQR